MKTIFLAAMTLLFDIIIIRSSYNLQVASQNLIQIYPKLELSFYFELLQLKVSFKNEIKSDLTVTIRQFAELLFVTYNSAASGFPMCSLRCSSF